MFRFEDNKWYSMPTHFCGWDLTLKPGPVVEIT